MFKISVRVKECLKYELELRNVLTPQFNKIWVRVKKCLKYQLELRNVLTP